MYTLAAPSYEAVKATVLPSGEIWGRTTGAVAGFAARIPTFDAIRRATELGSVEAAHRSPAYTKTTVLP